MVDQCVHTNIRIHVLTNNIIRGFDSSLESERNEACDSHAIHDYHSVLHHPNHCPKIVSNLVNVSPWQDQTVCRAFRRLRVQQKSLPLTHLGLINTSTHLYLVCVHIVAEEVFIKLAKFKAMVRDDNNLLAREAAAAVAQLLSLSHACMRAGGSSDQGGDLGCERRVPLGHGACRPHQGHQDMRQGSSRLHRLHVRGRRDGRRHSPIWRPRRCTQPGMPPASPPFAFSPAICSLPLIRRQRNIEHKQY